ncbi:uncharacterized protein RHO25_005010 [Cercospora beticola]|uniref:Uncharacterized protein n=1 Tax=Cercospora beticola TaxID=122368 RepID=A0ABZ0NLH9_CERBT|nr:hypothetical protein RHO25_005010 [Cercospora beticola]CAK1361401.1 unnamed protein product [Cercospora beticola]
MADELGDYTPRSVYPPLTVQEQLAWYLAECPIKTNKMISILLNITPAEVTHLQGKVRAQLCLLTPVKATEDLQWQDDDGDITVNTGHRLLRWQLNFSKATAKRLALAAVASGVQSAMPDYFGMD